MVGAIGFGIGLNFQQNLVPSWVLPGATVDMSFSTSQYYGDTLANLVSVSRASSGYAQTQAGLLVNFGSNVPRITDQGLLIEEARTNLAFPSSALATSPWNNGGISGTTTTNNAGLSPDGTNSATSISPTAQFGNATEGMTAAASSTYSVSFWVKVLSGNTALAIVVSDTIGGVVQSNDVHAITVTNVWARYTVQHVTASGINGINIIIQDRNASGFGTFLVWGAQAELGSFPTSYIPTTTAAAARAADSVLLTGMASVVSLAAAASAVSVVDNIQASGGRVLGSNVASQDYSGRPGASASATEMYNGVTPLTGNLAAVGSWATMLKIASGWSATGRSVVSGNGLIISDANTQQLSTQMFMGSNGGTNFIDGYVARMTLFNSRLPDATLKALTQ